jgi:hypothetical protein
MEVNVGMKQAVAMAASAICATAAIKHHEKDHRTCPAWRAYRNRLSHLLAIALAGNRA